MKGLKYLGILIVVLGFMQAYRNIRISFSSAQAAMSSIVPSNDTSDVDKSSLFESVSRTSVNAEVQESTNSKKALSLKNQLIQLIQQDRLCEFIKLAKEKKVSKQDQVKAFDSSFKERWSLHKDLYSIVDPDMPDVHKYRSRLGRSTMLGKLLGVFDKPVLQKQIDFKKSGMTKVDEDLLSVISEVQAKDANNLFYPFLKVQVFKKYKNRSEEMMEKLFNEIMASSYYSNPAFNAVRGLYLSSKTATQLHLANEFFQKKPFSHTYFITVGVWFFPDMDTRAHVAKVLGEHIESYDLSYNSFGYDPGVYKGFRMVLPFDEYFVTPPLEEFEASMPKPAFAVDELKVDLSKGCQEHLVEELRIKLRAL